jgi:mono/diheme cytochrome c family protein
MMKRLLLIATFAVSCVLGALGLAACDNGTQQAQALPSPGLPRGEVIFARYCNTCHPGGNRGSGPSLFTLVPHMDDDSIRAVIRKGKKQMPGYNSSTIPEDHMADLILYLRSLK